MKRAARNRDVEILAHLLRCKGRIDLGLHRQLRLVAGELFHAREDRAIAGAAADIAIEQVLDLALCGFVFLLVGQIAAHAHDPAVGAITTLCAVVLGQLVGHAVHLAINTSRAFDSGHAQPVECCHRAQAGIDRPMNHLAVLFRGQDHRAAPASALPAGLFRTAQPLFRGAQKVDQHRLGRWRVQSDLFAVQKEAYLV